MNMTTQMALKMQHLHHRLVIVSFFPMEQAMNLLNHALTTIKTFLFSFLSLMMSSKPSNLHKFEMLVVSVVEENLFLGK